MNSRVTFVCDWKLDNVVAEQVRGFSPAPRFNLRSLGLLCRDPLDLIT